MLSVNDLKLDSKLLGDHMILTEVVPVYEYKDRVKTENITGYKYIVALPAIRLEKVSVRIPGDQLMAVTDVNQEVEFSGLELVIYASDGNCYVAAKATGITPVTRKGVKPTE